MTSTDVRHVVATLDARDYNAADGRICRDNSTMTPRRKTRQVHVGPVAIGGDAPVSIQSMTSTYTYEIDKTVKQIHALATAGADIVRVAVPEPRDTAALASSVACPGPVVW